MFDTATRLVTIFLGISFALKKKKKKSLIPLLISPIGLISYIAYLKIVFNQPFYFLTAQSIFGQERATSEIILLPQVFYRYIKILLTTTGLTFANSAFELLSTIFVLVMLYLALKKKMNPSWLLFSFLAVIVPTLTGTLTSMPRYILIAFPMYIVLAQIKSSKAKISIIAIFLIIQTISMILFSRGYWVA